MDRRIYLDYNSDAPLLPAVVAAMEAGLSDYGNPSSQHGLGRSARSVVDGARQALGAYLEADSDYIIFTSSGTEANNQALRAADWDHVLVSAIEHESVLKAREDAKVFPVLPSGVVDLAALEEMLASLEGRILISLLWASNETGVLQPMEEVVALAQRYGARVHSDVTQAFGKVPLSFAQSGVDMMTLSAHKCGGPQGVGALIVKETVPLTAFIRGGGQEKNRRSGSENVLALRGLAALLVHVPDLGFLAPWHQWMESQLKGAQIVSAGAPRLPNTSCVVMPGILNQVQMMYFDLKGISLSVGSACSSGRITRSRVLEALPGGALLAPYAIRVSSGWDTTREDLEVFVELWNTLYEKKGSTL